MSQRTALETTRRLLSNRQWGRGYRCGRRGLFTPLAVDRGEAEHDGLPVSSEDPIIYIEHFRAKPGLSRKP
jgi:hypothetical protein